MSDQLTWFKSSYSDDEGGDCVEVALPGRQATVYIRDSKLTDSPELPIPVPAWSAFISAVPTAPTTPSPKS
ncbi:DUF397 domain-containing protein [Streptomyces sp. NBC_00827]|uniref:DUF397 domain-containing protein n=1 Tax=Streptomyces sp. NBC_00827 TaxID=2903677 RepID=UPI00386C8E7E|nr:DUF397 domain-containing protein [Streptomyces sp. NBC_00827]